MLKCVYTMLPWKDALISVVKLISKYPLKSPVYRVFLSVRPEPDFNSSKKDYSLSSGQEGLLLNSKLQFETNMLLFPAGNSKHWLVRVDKPAVGVVTKAQIVDYHVQILTEVMGKFQ
ncbi:chloroplast mRNA modification [Stylosanthes scabra]|uniref:Chloroplast mRNA modification n=1 Tax=Stylosanthes scabra TaxID=79078 RepID=A0ABU6UG48_9FABA|nr:chloroplast mRNA modification [Stylosanthes scabra]